MKKVKLLIVATVLLVCMLLMSQPAAATTSWMDECRPYQYTSVTEYSPTSVDGFTIGGTKHYEGYVFYSWYQTSLSQVLYNLKGEYSTFEFDIGRVDNTRSAPSKLYVYKDDLIAQEIDLSPSVLKTHVKLDVAGVKSLKLVCNTQGHYYDVYYGVFNGEWTASGVTAPAVVKDPWIRDCVPYDTSNTELFYTTADKGVVMAGDTYSDALRFYLWNPSKTATVSYNLDSDFKSFSFTFGHVDKTTRANGILTIKLDGVTDQTIELHPDSLPEKVTVDLTDVDQMILQFKSPNPLNTYDIYFAIGEGKFVSNGSVRAIYLSESAKTFDECTGTYKLSADVRPRDAVNKTVTWTTTDGSVAKVNASGKVTAVGVGTAQINAVTVDGKFTQFCTVTVPNNHRWEDLATVDKKATTARPGSKSIHCIHCGASRVGSEVIIPSIDTFQLSYTKVIYNGKNRTPTVMILDSMNYPLEKGTDYSVSYSASRSAVGRYTIKIKFKGDYSGTRNLYYTIVPKAPAKVNAELFGDYDDVKISWSKSVGATGYAVYYKNVTRGSGYKLLGMTSNRFITTEGKNVDLADGCKFTFKVVPYYYHKANSTRYPSTAYKTDSVITLEKLSAPTLRTSGSKVKVTWENIDGETGYQISRSTTKNGTNVILTKQTSTGRYATVSAPRGTRYYYKVRAYTAFTNSAGNRVFIHGPWSAVKQYTR